MSTGPPAQEAIEGWLRGFGLQPAAAEVRDGVVSWDLRCDGRKRSAIPITVIVAPGIGGVVWVPFASPLRDDFRKTYRELLRWNEEFPFVKFGLTEDERPVLAVEVPLERLDEDRLGEAIARCVAVCDLLSDDSARWRTAARVPAGHSASAAGLLERYRDRLQELLAPA